jgi:putative SOS response-associated peptidase YedK
LQRAPLLAALSGIPRLMSVSRYYELHDTPEGKQPYYFTRRDGQVTTIAAIRDVWDGRGTGERIFSCAMVITEPNKFVVEVPDRMPVVGGSQRLRAMEA